MAGVQDYTRNLDVSFTGVSIDSIPVVPSDTVDLIRPVRALRATGAGNIVVDTAAGPTRTMAFAAGETRTVIVTRVRATGTTATGIEAMP